MKAYECGNHRYVNAQTLKASQHFMVNKRDTGPEIIVKLGVPKGMWMLGIISKGELFKDKASSRVFIRRSWLIEYLETKLGTDEEVPKKVVSYRTSSKKSPRKEPQNDADEDPREILVYDAPPLLKIPPNKMFMVNDEQVDIEVRGTRTWDGCYFSLDSVGTAYGIVKPRTVLGSEHGKKTYKYGEDYVKFRVSKRVNGRNTSTEKIYMLMPGLVNMLAASKTPESKQFIKWVCTTIFTVAMGTDDQKLRLFSDSMDVSLAHAHRVLGKCPRVMQGIYYLQISEGLEPLVKDKRIGKLIQDAITDGTLKKSDHFVKLGMSKKYDDTEVRRSSQLGLSRRFAEHERGFAKILGTDPKVISFGDILDKQTSIAEKEALDTAREYCRDFSFPGHDEWFVLPSRKASDFKTAIDNIIREHEITYSDLMTDVEASNKTIADLKASLKLAITKQEAEASAHEKDIEKLKKIHEIELRSRDELLISKDELLISKDELLRSKDEMIDILKATLAGKLSEPKKTGDELRRRRKKSRR